MKKMQTAMLLKEDVDVLKSLLENEIDLPGSDEIREKLKHANVVDYENFDNDVARVGSLLLIRDKSRRENFQYRLSVPDPGTKIINTDNVFRPLGAALLGMRKGEEIKWKTSKGLRYLFIVSVVTPIEVFY